MRLWRIFGDAAETDMRCGSDGIREEGAKTSSPSFSSSSSMSFFPIGGVTNRTGGKAQNRKDSCHENQGQLNTIQALPLKVTMLGR